MLNTEEYICKKSQRLDAFLTTQIDQTRSQIATLIKNGAVYVGEKQTMRPGVKLKVGEKVRVEFPKKKVSAAQDVAFDVEILYEDEDVLVINKPSGVTVHPAPSVKEPTLVDWLKHKGIRLSTISGEERHGIVHRLDKGTSGAMVVAKNNEAHEFLSKQLQDKSMGRYYLALIEPPLKEACYSVEADIGRNVNNRLKMSTNVQKGKYAKTVFVHLALSDSQKQQLIACKLFTGRTHQIRVHLEASNRHIVGDHIYGLQPKQESAERILLHAYILYFIHPQTKKRLFFVADLDNYMKTFLEKKFTRENLDEIIDSDTLMHNFNHLDERMC